MLSVKSISRKSNLYLKPARIFRHLQYQGFPHCLSTLAILEQRDGSLQNSSLSAITAALKFGGPVTALIAGGNAKSVAETAAKFKGVNRIILINNVAYDKVCS